MLTTDQRNLILYQSQIYITEKGIEIQEKEAYSEPCDLEYAQLFKALNYIAVLQDTDVTITLDDKEIEYIYRCLQNSLNLQNYPVAGVPYLLTDNVTFIVGAPGQPGAAGAPGADGTDADINVVGHPDGNITVVTTFPGGVKTATIQYTPYVVPAITIDLDDSVIIDPDQYRVMQLGLIISVLTISIHLVKGKNPVTASTFTNPPALDPAYQSLLDLVTLNSVGTLDVSVLPSNVQATTTYSVSITDGTSTPIASAVITFVYPFLYGATVAGGAPGTGTSMYTVLSKLIKTKANHTVVFNNTSKFFWFAYPESYGDLLSSPNVGIKDQNGFDVTASFTKFTGVSTTSAGLDSNWTTNYIFYRTTLATDISGPYTFYFS